MYLLTQQQIFKVLIDFESEDVTGNKFIKEVNPMNSTLFKNLDIEKSKKILVKQINKIIRS